MKRTPIDPEKSTVATLHYDCVIHGLEFRLRVQRYRSRMLFTDEEQPLDRILAELHTLIKKLSGLAHQEDAAFPDHIGAAVDRVMAEMAARRNAEELSR